jgi:hypothetical protein
VTPTNPEILDSNISPHISGTKPFEILNIMKKTVKAIAMSPATVNNTSVHALPDVWLSPLELSTLRKSISAQTLQELFEYHEDLWEVVCTGHKREYLGFFEAGRVPKLDAFVRMLITDSQQLRGAKLKAARDAQVDVLRANWAMSNDPLWKLDGSEILVIKA